MYLIFLTNFWPCNRNIVFYLLILLFILLSYNGFSCFYLGSEAMKPCPNVKPQTTTVNIDNYLGVWHLSLLVLDSTHEDFVETDICVTGELARYNSTVVRQMWSIESYDSFNEPSAIFEFPTTVIRPGLWAVHTPLGGQLKAIVFDSLPQSHILVTHCGLHRGKLVHLWTAAVTRTREITPYLKLKLTTSLIENGFDPTESKVITWNKC